MYVEVCQELSLEKEMGYLRVPKRETDHILKGHSHKNDFEIITLIRLD
jgi:hypothetical protein